ncbi:hypothetical protein [Hyalangium versicolor]|uniref:hypothetical protein n=1 Tax=Hyalangium versicolor TaxID=2861190 RepID=UPI001CCFA736|nr:hypothetical protein [Hyalangium versicolor]
MSASGDVADDSPHNPSVRTSSVVMDGMSGPEDVTVTRETDAAEERVWPTETAN